MSFENFQKLIDAFVEAPLRTESEEEEEYYDENGEEVEVESDLHKSSHPAPISLNEVSYRRDNIGGRGPRGGRSSAQEANAKLYPVDDRRKPKNGKSLSGALTQENLIRAGLTREVDVIQKVHRDTRIAVKKPVVVEPPAAEEVPTAAPISLDDVSYDREVKYINLPRGSRPATSSINPSSRAVKQMQAIAENNALDFNELDQRYRRMDDLKKQHDATATVTTTTAAAQAPVVKKLYEVPASATTAREKKPPRERKEKAPRGEGRRDRSRKDTHARDATVSAIIAANTGSGSGSRGGVERSRRMRQQEQEDCEDESDEQGDSTAEVESDGDDSRGDYHQEQQQQSSRRKQVSDPSMVNRYLTEAQREQLDLQREIDLRREKSRQQREAKRDAKRAAAASAAGGVAGANGTERGGRGGGRGRGEGKVSGRRAGGNKGATATAGGGAVPRYDVQYDPSSIYYDESGAMLYGDYDGLQQQYEYDRDEEGQFFFIEEPAPPSASTQGYYDPVSKTFYPSGLAPPRPPTAAAAAAAETTAAGGGSVGLSVASKEFVPSSFAFKTTAKEFVPSFMVKTTVPAADKNVTEVVASASASETAVSPSKLNINAKSFEFRAS